jgi:hypothetical protein
MMTTHSLRRSTVMTYVLAVALLGPSMGLAQASESNLTYSGESGGLNELCFPAAQQAPDARGAGCLQLFISTGSSLFDANGQCVAHSSECHETAQGDDAGDTTWTVHNGPTSILGRFDCYPLDIMSTTLLPDATLYTWKGAGQLCREAGGDGTGFFQVVACAAMTRDGVQHACVSDAVPFAVFGPVWVPASGSETRAHSNGGDYYTGTLPPNLSDGIGGD